MTTPPLPTTIPADVVDACLRLEGQGVIRQVDWFAELPSTNDHALQLAANPVIELPRLIWAERQTAGRGRGTHQWWSGPGALTVSLLTDGAALGLTPASWPQVSVLTGLAVAELLGRLVGEHRVGLKWPNDVLIERRKVAGILVEVPPSAGDRLVIGLGLNVGNSLATAPAELRATAGSLRDWLAVPPSTAEVLVDFCQTWSRVMQAWAGGNLPLVSRWSRHCVLTDRRVRVTAGERSVEGRCCGIDHDGALLIETGAARQRVLGGTVRLLDGGA